MEEVGAARGSDSSEGTRNLIDLGGGALYGQERTGGISLKFELERNEFTNLEKEALFSTISDSPSSGK